MQINKDKAVKSFKQIKFLRSFLRIQKRIK